MVCYVYAFDSTNVDINISLNVERSTTKSATGTCEDAVLFDITEFKLRVKVIRAVNLTPVGEKGRPS